MFFTFMAFVCVWVVLGFWAASRKWHDSIAWGATFVVSLFIVSGGAQLIERYGTWKQHQSAQAQQHDGRINQARILAGLGEYAPELALAPADTGKARALGKTQGGSAGVLEVSGKALEVEVEKATLMFPAKLADQAIASANVQMATRYVQTLFPDWASPGTWLEDNALASAEAKTVEREGRRITVKLSSELNMWLLTVEKI